MKRMDEPQNANGHLAGLAVVVACATVGLFPLAADAAELYVSPSGSDSAAGSEAVPFATLQKANDSASAGDTIWLRGGTFGTNAGGATSASGTGGLPAGSGGASATGGSSPSGCGCSLGASAAHSGPLVVLALAALLAPRRRRSHAPSNRARK